MSEHSKRIGEATGFGLRRFGKALGALLSGRPDPQEQVFIETVFVLFGHLAQADGHVSQKEAELGEKLIEHMQLGRSGRRLAVSQFELGKRGDFVLDSLLQRFNQHFAPYSERSRELLEVLIAMARVDGKMRPAVRGLLEKIAQGLKIAPLHLKERLEQGKALPTGLADSSAHVGLLHAYGLLGIAPEVSDDDLRQAYRRLISKLHPDKLIGQGLADADLQAAQERTQQVRAAYELACAARGIR
jgi:DnaJ like chaperone protein